ncbi:TetR/AcrR family transcriptional regulator [Alkalihalobacterium bogoriense]|uniref:TetR/AcrR family transcriptional regulator n=1 Tax=Alkalihalobacterium bogoriense TaxID=246272 RepID=UPI00047B71EF|nr:TetR/AcrR family transcriptional regulator [Alkalihalobacterium bogoriense]
MSPRMGLDLQTILLAATNIVDEGGIEALTMATLAKTLNVQSPSLYNHIDGLQGLKKHLAQYGLEKLYKGMKEAVNDKQGEEAILSIGHSYLEFVRTHPGLYEMTLKAPDAKDVEIEKVANEIVYLMIDVITPYHLEKDQTIHMVRGIRSLLHGFASLEQAGGFGFPLDLNESFENMVRTYLIGMKHISK